MYLVLVWGAVATGTGDAREARGLGASTDEAGGTGKAEPPVKAIKISAQAAVGDVGGGNSTHYVMPYTPLTMGDVGGSNSTHATEISTVEGVAGAGHSIVGERKGEIGASWGLLYEAVMHTLTLIQTPTLTLTLTLTLMSAPARCYVWCTAREGRSHAFLQFYVYLHHY